MLRLGEEKPKRTNSSSSSSATRPATAGHRPKTAGASISSAMKQMKRSSTEDVLYANFVASKQISRRPSAPSVKLTSSLSSAVSIPSSFDFVSLASALPLSPKHSPKNYASSPQLLQRPKTAPEKSSKSTNNSTITERVDLANRGFTVFPCLSHERFIKSLNLQGNSLAFVPELASYQSLTFLDLHNNKLDETPMLRLPALKVLMLSKNFIRRIENVKQLISLDILDLNENHVTEIDTEFPRSLRVLNLEKNRIEEAVLSSPLDSLIELNLNRNIIRRIDFVIPRLKRLLLSHNRIQSSNDVKCVQHMKLVDLLLLGCPVMQSHQECWQIVQSVSTLTTFNYEKISENYRKSSKLFNNLLDKNVTRPPSSSSPSISLRDVLCNLWQKWLDDGCQKLQSMPPECNADALYGICEGDSFRVFQDGSLYISRNDSLFIFGSSAFMASFKIDATKFAKHVHLAFLDIHSTAPHFERLNRFQSLNSISFSYNNIDTLEDVILLSRLPNSIDDLTIHPSGNFVTTFNLFFDFAVYRLYPLPQRTLNGCVLDIVVRQKAAKKFECLERLFCLAPVQYIQAIPRDQIPVRLDSLSVWQQKGDMNLDLSEKFRLDCDMVEIGSNDVVQRVLTYAKEVEQRARWFDEAWPETINQILKEAIEQTLFNK